MSEDPDEWLFKPIETSVAVHHRVILSHIQQCIAAPYGRLMILAPPGSAKSTYAAVVGPTWVMGRVPGTRVLMTSYASGPITRHSKRARQVANSPAYHSIFGTNIVFGSNAADEWELTNGSGLFAAGLMGGITSTRCDVGIIDDAVAGREEADSETMRRKTRQAYDDDFLTRLKPKASIILMNTRWHVDDLMGSILPEDYDGRSGWVHCRDGQDWYVLNIQAKCERSDDPVGRKIGEYLWPEWFDAKHWAIYESQPRTWNALYQQRPTIAEGGQFKLADFHRYDKAPDDVVWYLPGDWAVTKLMESNNPDFTSIGVVGIDPQGDVWCEHGYHAQDTVDKSIDAALDLAKAFKCRVTLMERGVIKNAVEGQFSRRMRERGPFLAMEFLTTSADKTAMAASFRGLAASGKVHVKQSPWGDKLLSELCAFPYSAKDDMVDMCSLVGRYIDEMNAPKRDKDQVRKKHVPPPKMSLPARAAEGYKHEDEEQARRDARFKG